MWPGAAFGQSTVFTALLGLCLNFHMEQEGELMLHYESSSARAAANLNQVIQWSKWGYVLLGPGQVEMCYWCITKRNAGKESSHISFYRDASWFSDSPDYVAFNEDFEGETSEDQKVVTDRWLQYLCLLLLLFNIFFFPWALPPHWLIDITSLEPIWAAWFQDGPSPSFSGNAGAALTPNSDLFVFH